MSTIFTLFLPFGLVVKAAVKRDAAGQLMKLNGSSNYTYVFPCIHTHECEHLRLFNTLTQYACGIGLVLIGIIYLTDKVGIVCAALLTYSLLS